MFFPRGFFRYSKKDFSKNPIFIDIFEYQL